MKLPVFCRCGTVIFCVLAVILAAEGVRSSDNSQPLPDVKSVIFSVAGSLGYAVMSADEEKKTVLFTSNRDGIFKTIRIIFSDDGKTMDISAKVTGESDALCQELSVRIVEEFIRALSNQPGRYEVEQSSLN